MATVEIVDKERKAAGTVELPDAVFGTEVKGHLLHRVVVAQLAGRRAGTHQTKTRSDVSGGGRKPFRQKGTRKETRAALVSALSAKAKENKLVLVDDLSLPAPKTREFLKVAAALGLTDALLVFEGTPENLELGVRNLKAFKTIPVSAINVYDVLSYDQLVLTRPALEKITEVLGK
jgi:large subunit ribosomal protein L4